MRVFRMLKNCGGGEPAPSTVKKVKPVCGIRIVCATALIVIVIATVTLCAGFVLETVTVPEYVPGFSPLGLAVTLTGVDANALTMPLAGAALNHESPAVLALATVNEKEPPPTFDTDSGRVTAAAPCTNENVMLLGFRLRLG